MKKKLLIIYPHMMLGGSTTSLLALLNNLDFEKFDVELQLFQNVGPLINYIPNNVRLLPPVKKYKTSIQKNLAFLFSGYAFKALFESLKQKKIGLSSSIIGDFIAKKNSIKNSVHYDYAISFLEGWSARYLAYGVTADKKYAWLHSTFANITNEPKAQLSWMMLVDKIIFVTDACRDDFKLAMPEMADKAITIENITDGEIIRKRSEDPLIDDSEYASFTTSQKTKIITVCRIDISTKGLDRILNAAKKLKDAGCNFIWYIIGAGEDMNTLLNQINENNLSDYVFAIGIRMNPYPFIKAADIMCMPSRYEGKPMVITESMILGTPPIVTKYLSANEQIENGVEGIIAENSDDSIAPYLIDLINNSNKINDMRNILLSRNYDNRNYIEFIEKSLFD